MNLNKVQIIGRITKDPEVRVTQSGASVLTLSVATNSSWTDKKTGEKKKETEFHSVKAWGKTADAIGKWFAKGDEIYIEGKLKTSSYEDKNGVKRYQTSIIADKFDFGQKKQQGATSDRGEATMPKDGGDLSNVPDLEDEVSIDDLPF